MRAFGSLLEQKFRHPQDQLLGPVPFQSMVKLRSLLNVVLGWEGPLREVQKDLWLDFLSRFTDEVT